MWEAMDSIRHPSQNTHLHIGLCHGVDIVAIVSRLPMCRADLLGNILRLGMTKILWIALGVAGGNECDCLADSGS